MKKAVIIFLFIFIITLLIPMFSLVETHKDTTQSELVTIFSEEASQTIDEQK